MKRRHEGIRGPRVPTRPELGKVLVGAGVARARNLSRENEISIRGADGRHDHLTVDEIFSGESELVNNDLVLVAADDFRRLFGIAGGYATDLTRTVKNPSEIPTVGAKVQALLPDARVILRSDIQKTYDAVLDWRGGVSPTPG